MSNHTASYTPDKPSSEVKEDARGILQSLRRVFDQLGPIRLAFTLLFIFLAIVMARFSWHTPLIQDAERALYDLRASVFAPEIEKDDRIVLIVYNEDTLKLTGQRSPVDRTILAQSLETIDAAGAKSIGIDILFDMPQDDDQLLLSAFNAMRTPTYLAYASPESNTEIDFAQHQFLSQFLDRIKNNTVKPTSIRLETGSDGVARQWTAQKANLPPFFAIALTKPNPKFAENSGAIRYVVPSSQDMPVFDKFPIESFADPATADMLASFIRDKYVLIGGDFVDRDRFETPVGSLSDSESEDGRMIGLEVHAHMLAQLLNDDLPAPIPGWTLWDSSVYRHDMRRTFCASDCKSHQSCGNIVPSTHIFHSVPIPAAKYRCGHPHSSCFWMGPRLVVWICFGRISGAYSQFKTTCLCAKCPR